MHYVVSAACMEYDALDSFIVNTFIDNIPVFLIPFIESPAKLSLSVFAMMFTRFSSSRDVSMSGF